MGLEPSVAAAEPRAFSSFIAGCTLPAAKGCTVATWSPSGVPWIRSPLSNSRLFFTSARAALISVAVLAAPNSSVDLSR